MVRRRSRSAKLAEPSRREAKVGQTHFDTPLFAGRTYVYKAGLPEARAGHKYRLLRFVLDVPSYQHKCLVKALTGPDEGLWFVVSTSNFSRRYVLDEGEQEVLNAAVAEVNGRDAPPAPSVAPEVADFPTWAMNPDIDLRSKGKGV
jgi:hypothetical protein